MAEQQPEALWLADALYGPFPEAFASSAAAELRRLHAENEMLWREREEPHKTIDLYVRECNRLEAERDQLLGALKGCLIWMESLRASGDAGNWEWEQDDEYVKGIAAIAKAQGESK